VTSLFFPVGLRKAAYPENCVVNGLTIIWCG